MNFRKKFLVLLVFLTSVVFLSLFIGPVSLSFNDFIFAIKNPSSNLGVIFFELRLDRIIAAALVGGMLAISGVFLQGIFMNPLVDPYIFGVSSSAGFFYLLSLYLGLPVYQNIIFCIFGGCLILFIFMILNSFTQNSLILVLTGVIISSFMNALISLILIISPSVLSKSMLYWLLGSFNLVETQFFFLAILAIFIVLIFNNYFSHGINLIGLGDEKSSSLGLNVKKFRLMVLLTTSLFVVLSILIAGIIGYIGLIIPHICRMMGIYNAKHLIPIAALFGAIFLIVSDDIARSILSPSELPIGIVTAIVGLPIFLFIILNLKKNVRN